jgi:hypothetical protein
MSKLTKYHFDSAYFVRRMPNHESIKPVLLGLLDTAKHDSDKQDVQVISRYDYHQSTEPRPWVAFFDQHISTFMRTLPKEIIYTDPIFSSIWFQQYEQNEYHSWHTHSRCSFSGIYYLELPSDSCATEFIEPYDIYKTHSMYVAEGDVVIFPSFLIHSSPKNPSMFRKTIVAFNFDFMGVNLEINKG